MGFKGFFKSQLLPIRRRKDTELMSSDSEYARCITKLMCAHSTDLCGITLNLTHVAIAIELYIIY